MLLALAGFVFSCTPAINEIDPAKAAFVWAGGVTDTSATFTFKATDTAYVAVYQNEALVATSARVAPGAPATVTIGGLSSTTAYTYRVETAPDSPQQINLRGKFTTFSKQPISYRFAFGSCARTGSESEIFETIANDKPLFFLHTGDMFYGDVAELCDSVITQHYLSVILSPAQQKLWHSVPLAYMWDDHDFGPNNSAADAPCKEAVMHIYRNYIPHYPLDFKKPTSPISQSFIVGRVRFVMPDMRSMKRRPKFNSDCEKTAVGSNFGSDEHFAWFSKELREAKAAGQVVAFVSGIPWINNVGGPYFDCDEDDDWGGFNEERTKIANLIKKLQVPVFILSGDAHMLAMDDGTNSDYATGGGAPVKVFHAGALDRVGVYKGGPYSHGFSVQSGQYGLMEVIDEGGNEICFRWQGKNHEGKLMPNQLGRAMEYKYCITL